MARICIFLGAMFFLGIPVRGQRISPWGPFYFSEYEQKEVNRVIDEFGFSFSTYSTKDQRFPRANFASFYEGTQESCGTECVTFQMKELLTGKIYGGPQNCPGGFLFFPDSYLIVCNYDAIGDKDLLKYEWYTPRAYLWDDRKWDFFEKVTEKAK